VEGQSRILDGYDQGISNLFVVAGFNSATTKLQV
jgi:hypothetical protein